MPNEPHSCVTLNLRARLDACKRQVMQEALDACHGNVSQAAVCLGISRAKIYRLLEAYAFVHDHRWHPAADEASPVVTRTP